MPQYKADTGDDTPEHTCTSEQWGQSLIFYSWTDATSEVCDRGAPAQERVSPEAEIS
jgi:hypothetical protein